jgi:hypothetical protein
MEGGCLMKNKMYSLLMLAGFLLAAQPAGAIDAGKWFTGRVAAFEKNLAESQTPARSSGRENHSSSLQQVMKHLKEKHHQKKQHGRH